MNNYHEFKCDDEVEIKEWWLYWLPNYVSTIKKTMIASGMLTPITIQLVEVKVLTT
jgi:hypothetical protein